jgi:hypothetical protein
MDLNPKPALPRSQRAHHLKLSPIIVPLSDLAGRIVLLLRVDLLPLADNNLCFRVRPLFETGLDALDVRKILLGEGHAAGLGVVEDVGQGVQEGRALPLLAGHHLPHLELACLGGLVWLLGAGRGVVLFEIDGGSELAIRALVDHLGDPLHGQGHCLLLLAQDGLLGLLGKGGGHLLGGCAFALLAGLQVLVFELAGLVDFVLAGGLVLGDGLAGVGHADPAERTPLFRDVLHYEYREIDQGVQLPGGRASGCPASGLRRRRAHGARGRARRLRGQHPLRPDGSRGPASTQDLFSQALREPRARRPPAQPTVAVLRAGSPPLTRCDGAWQPPCW